MAYMINSREMKDTLARSIKGNSITQDITMSKVAVPIIDIGNIPNRINDTVISNFISNATSQVLLTTATDKDFYLTSANINYIKDATSTATDISITIIINGATTKICRIAGITLTANSGNIPFNPMLPIKIDRGTAITLISDTNVANILARATITGFYTSSF